VKHFMLRKRRVAQAVAVAGLGLGLAGCTTFGNGQHVVGTGKYDVQPGLYSSSKYVSSDVGSQCIWLRDDVPDMAQDAAGNDEEFGGFSYVQILPTDKNFLSLNCGLWTLAKPTSNNPDRATAKTGAYRIPTDLLPGTYTAPGGPQCAWTRVSSFKGDLASIIATSVPPGGINPGITNPRVTIARTDAGFLTDLCGGWRRVGP
jgi:hypothetical protein